MNNCFQMIFKYRLNSLSILRLNTTALSKINRHPDMSELDLKIYFTRFLRKWHVFSRKYISPKLVENLLQQKPCLVNVSCLKNKTQQNILNLIEDTRKISCLVKKYEIIYLRIYIRYLYFIYLLLLPA